MRKATKPAESAIGNITSKAALPISFEQFSKDPVKGLLFIVIIAIGYLYADGKFNYTNQIEKHETKIEISGKSIFLLWFQGWDENIPWVVKKVKESWELHNPDWNIVLLSNVIVLLLPIPK